MNTKNSMLELEKISSNGFFSEFKELDCASMRAVYRGAYAAGWAARESGKDVNGNPIPSEPFVQSD